MRNITGALTLTVVVGLLFATRDSAELPASDGAASVELERDPAFKIPVVPLGASACADAGYLCSGLEQVTPARAFRWPDGTESLKIGRAHV